jgi:DNA-directed RNA polymerase specialized sigma24 family protein
MIESTGHHHRRCPVCDEPVRRDCECARCAENSELRRELGELSTPHSPWIVEILESFYLSDEELAAVKPQIIPELIRRAPQFVQSVIIAVVLPMLQERARRHYAAKGVPYAEAEELAATFVLNVLKAIFGQELRGNSGAFVAKIRSNVLMDHWRTKERQKRRFGKRKGVTALADFEDTSLDEASLKFVIDGLPPQSREIVQRMAEDAKWAELAAHCQQKLNEAKNPIQSIEWPEGSLPLRKKRRRRRPAT